MMMKYRPLAVLVLLILFSLGQALAQKAVIHEPNSEPPKKVTIKGSVSVQLVDSGLAGAALPVVEAMINGRGPYRLGIETGAGFVGLNAKVAESLSLPRSGGPDEYPEFHVDSISLGGATFQDLTVTAMPKGARGVDGVLGLSFFRNVLLTIDYPARQLRLSNDLLPAPNGKDILPLVHDGPFWAMPLQIANQRFSAILDTRSMGGLSVSPEVASGLPFEGELRVVGRAGGAAIPMAEVKAGRLKGNATLGAYTFPRPLIAVRSLPPGFPAGPLVGASVLQNFVVSLDQRGKLLRLTHEGSSTIALPEPQPKPDAAPTTAAPVAGVVASDDLPAYAGRYGDRTITLEAGVLYLQRPGGPKLELVRSGKDEFGLRDIPQAKMEFQRDANGALAALRVLNREGVWETVPRVSDRK